MKQPTNLSSVLALGMFVSATFSTLGADPPKPKGPTMAEVLAASKPNDWREVDPENTLYLELAGGRVVIELAPAFAPKHVTNVKALAREHYYDGLAIIRVQDNYVVQWGDPDADKPGAARKIQNAQRTLRAEFDRPLDPKLPFSRLADGDLYAPEVGFSEGFPVARDPGTGRMWLVHTYGMVGAGRDTSPDSGGGTELYVVIGQAPRHLDRNVTLLGRVLLGMELLSALPRGPAPMGFYEKPEQRVPIKAVRVAADVPESERSALEVLRTDTPTFRDLVESRRKRREEWFQVQANRIDIAAVPVPVRPKSKEGRKTKRSEARTVSRQPAASRHEKAQRSQVGGISILVPIGPDRSRWVPMAPGFWGARGSYRELGAGGVGSYRELGTIRGESGENYFNVRIALDRLGVAWNDWGRCEL